MRQHALGLDDVGFGRLTVAAEGPAKLFFHADKMAAERMDAQLAPEVVVVVAGEQLGHVLKIVEPVVDG
ncbi:MAG: hypothetical protein ACREP1_09275, partial [Rhodanobacteraceae bacterium]